MPIPCAACRRPVHDTVVTCPHCNEPTGVAPDSHVDAAEIAALLATDPARDVIAQPSPLSAAIDADPLVASVAVAASVVEAVIETVREARAAPALPTAVAHVRRRHVAPNPSTEPAKTEPPPSGEEPRFLK